MHTIWYVLEGSDRQDSVAAFSLEAAQKVWDILAGSNGVRMVSARP